MIEEFHRPKSVREALRLKGKLGGHAVFLAGGTFVNSKDFPLRPLALISLDGLGLDRVRESRVGTTIGALCTLEELIEDPAVPLPLKRALAQVVSRNVRAAATLGGHVARASSCSDVIPMLVALGAEVELATGPASAGSRAGVVAHAIPVEEFVKSRKDGIITKIVIPKGEPDRRAVCRTLRASSNSKSMLTTAVSLSHRKGSAIVEAPIVALGGIARHTVRLAAVEHELAARPLPDTTALEAMVRRHVHPMPCRSACLSPCLTQTHGGTPEFKTYEAGVLVARALREAASPSGKGGRS